VFFCTKLYYAYVIASKWLKFILLIGFVVVEAIEKKEAEHLEEVTNGVNDEDNTSQRSELTTVHDTADTAAAATAASNDDTSSETTTQNAVSCAAYTHTHTRLFYCSSGICPGPPG